MSQLYPIPRGTREVSLVTAAGQTVFGPVAFRLFDAVDIEIWATAPGGIPVQLAANQFTATPAAPDLVFPAAAFLVTLAAARPAGSTLTVRGARIPERITDVTRAGVLQSTRIEAELDRVTVVTQELRRDAGRALTFEPVSGVIDARGYRVVNAAAPIGVQDVVTLGFGSANYAHLDTPTTMTALGARLKDVSDPVGLNDAVNKVFGTLNYAHLDTPTTMTALGARLKDVSDPVNANDAVNKTWAETAMSSSVAQANAAAAQAQYYATQAAAGVDYFTPSGAGKAARPIVEVIADYSHSVFGQTGMAANGTDVTAQLQAWFNDKRAGFLPPGRYGVTAPIQMPVNAVIEAPGWNAYGAAGGAVIERIGVWAGPTLRFGTAGSSCVRPTMRNIQIDQLHPGFVPGTSISIPDRQINDDACHVEINGGDHGLFENNRLTHGRRHFDIKGGSNHTFRANHHVGYWDDQTAALKETFSYYRVRNILGPFNLGLATSHKIFDVQAWAAFSPQRTVTSGTVSFTSHQGAAARHGLEIYGCEDLQIRGGYIGGCGYSNVYIEPDATFCTAIGISGIFFDAAAECDILVSGSLDQRVVKTLHVIDNKFNGQLLGRNVMVVDKGASTAPVVAGLLFALNTCENHMEAPLLLGAVRGGLVNDNVFTNYHARNGGVGNAVYSAGMLVSDVSRKVYSRSNYYGGGVNDMADNNNCQYTAVWSGLATGNSIGDIDDTWLV